MVVVVVVEEEVLVVEEEFILVYSESYTRGVRFPTRWDQYGGGEGYQLAVAGAARPPWSGGSGHHAMNTHC